MTDLLNNIQNIIDTLPPKPPMILVTRYLNGFWKAEFEGKKYFLVGYLDWVRLDHDRVVGKVLGMKIVCLPDSAYTSPSLFMANVREDEELVKRILLNAIQGMTPEEKLS